MHEGQGGGGAQVGPTARHRILLIASVAGAVAADQISKSIALAVLEEGKRVDLFGRFFGFLLVRNPGGAFSLLPGGSSFLALLTAAVIAAVAFWAFRSGESPVAFGLVVGGGLGNLADRLLRATSASALNGRVIDFLDLNFWPTFNLADAAISIGVIFLLWRAFRSK